MRNKIKGRVTQGSQLGRKLGFPTANIAIDNAAIADGVYAGMATFDGTQHRSMIYVGTKPSVATGARRMMEVNVFDFDGDLYDKEIEVELLKYIRPQRRFASTEELRAAIAADRQAISAFFRTLR